VFFEIFHECPLVLLSTTRSKKVCRDILDYPPFNLNTSSRSALLRHSSSVHSPSYDNTFLSWGNCLVEPFEEAACVFDNWRPRLLLAICMWCWQIPRCQKCRSLYIRGYW